MARKITVRDVALEAGVSRTSVSLVLNDKECSIPENTKIRIREAANKLEYVPNHIARSLATNKTKTIGVIIPNISNSFFAEIVRHIQIELNKYGYDIFLCDSDEKLKNDIKYIKLLASRNVDGLILTMSAQSLSKENIESVKNVLNKTGVPFVLLDRYFKGDAPKVLVDNVDGGYKVCKYLIENGHRDIGLITGPLTLNSSSDRLEGVKKALEENNLKLNKENIFSGNYDIETGRLGANKLLGKVKTIFAFNDMQAFGVIEAAKAMGLKMPRDFSLVGFDDTFYSQILETQLTTVSQPSKDIAMNVCGLILKCIDNPDYKEEIRLKTELIIRDSVKKYEESYI